jgi:hypothetical protein
MAFAGIAGAAFAGCGGSSTVGEKSSEGSVRLAPDLLPLPAGRTAAYRLPAIGAAVRRRRTVAGLSCESAAAHGHGIHLELYARRLVVPVPAGIGIAPPVQRSGAYVRGGTCAYPIRTYEPTGLVVIDRRSPLRLADFFAVWGQPLSGHSMAGFHGSVRAYVDGRRWSGRLGQIPLRPHAEIVLELGAFVPPHPRYGFPPGL